MDVDDLANEIRRIDGNKDTAASVLAEKLMPFLRAERLAGMEEAAALAYPFGGAIRRRISHLEKGGE